MVGGNLPTNPEKVDPGSAQFFAGLISNMFYFICPQFDTIKNDRRKEKIAGKKGFNAYFFSVIHN